MKNISAYIGNCMHKLESRWEGFTLRRQRRYVLYCFLAYSLLTIMVLVRSCLSNEGLNESVVRGHINNPVIKQMKAPVPVTDSNLNAFKNKSYAK